MRISQMKFIPLVVLVLLVAACTPRGPERTREQNPKVSYNYSEDDLDEVKQTAAKYCRDKYGRSARIVDDLKSGDQRVMTFECVIKL
jgi:hypothetical protein